MLSRHYSNPSNSATTIPCTLGAHALVTLAVFNASHIALRDSIQSCEDLLASESRIPASAFCETYREHSGRNNDSGTLVRTTQFHIHRFIVTAKINHRIRGMPHCALRARSVG